MGLAGGLNTIPYQAESLSFGNTRKNLLARIEIPKKSQIIAPYPTYETTAESEDEKLPCDEIQRS